MPFTASDICKIILAIILPPLGVFLERGCNADFFINILLTILGYIPGIIHALYVKDAPAQPHPEPKLLTLQQLHYPEVLSHENLIFVPSTVDTLAYLSRTDTTSAYLDIPAPAFHSQSTIQKTFVVLPAISFRHEIDLTRKAQRFSRHEPGMETG
ncbi:plasma membrane proteolipid 3 [Fonsecaea multimorphosa]|nr:plasma membrane proteolipid 3 [Fonsecaea multimorphosa]